MSKRIYKFVDTVDFEAAFVVSESRLDAEHLLEKHTSLELEFIKDVDLEDFPKAIFNKPLPYIWINNILPF